MVRNCKPVSRAVSQPVILGVLTWLATSYTAVAEETCCADAAFPDPWAWMCYESCPEGSTGFGNICTPGCPEDFTDVGLLCAKPAPYTRPGYPWQFGDGFDLTPAEERCEADHPGGCEEHLGIIYPKCREGYWAVACCICSPNCPQGATDLGHFCSKATTVRSGPTAPDLQCALEPVVGFLKEAYEATIGRALCVKDAVTDLVNMDEMVFTEAQLEAIRSLDLTSDAKDAEDVCTGIITALDPVLGRFQELAQLGGCAGDFVVTLTLDANADVSAFGLGAGASAGVGIAFATNGDKGCFINACVGVEAQTPRDFKHSNIAKPDGQVSVGATVGIIFSGDIEAVAGADMPLGGVNIPLTSVASVQIGMSRSVEWELGFEEPREMDDPVYSFEVGFELGINKKPAVYTSSEPEPVTVAGPPADSTAPTTMCYSELIRAEDV